MLLEVQYAFVRAILGQAADLEAMCAHRDGPSLQDRIQVYRQNCLGTLTNSLALTFPAVEKLVGCEFFAWAARSFVEGNQAVSACLDDYGGEFPDFLANLAEARSLAYLPGVARLEWAIARVIGAPDAAPVDLDRLSAGTPDVARLRLNPASRIVEDSFPVDEIWRAVETGDSEALARLDMTPRPVHLLVDQHDDGIRIAALDPGEASVLGRLVAGEPLETIISQMDRTAAAVLLSRHLAAGRFVETVSEGEAFS